MARYSASKYLESLYQPKTINVNGVDIPMSEYKKKQKALTKKKRTKTCTSITILPTEIKRMMRNVRVLKSLVAYHEHGYRQWGTIATMLMNLKEIKSPFNKVVINTKQAIRLVDKINGIAKKNDRDVYQYTKKLSWKLEDVRTELDNLVGGVSSSGVTTRFGNHECINGCGKRLGLGVLTSRSRKAIDELYVICNKLNDIEEKGMDVFEYNSNGKQVKF